ncbi:hypothetical protein Cgig2_017612 [Carnegiea gigantea]|uniref:Uncharacterized protein n=1 Tax=Carnegiea gigantea TaxID=171969 RepID=A0A9Q1GNN1_9CARY|nr:hypothetical protein Cgig2_017612 [Carnegiea gigantea]
MATKDFNENAANRVTPTNQKVIKAMEFDPAKLRIGIRSVKLVGNDELRIIEEDVYLTMVLLRECKPVEEAKKSTRDIISSKDLWAIMNFELESCQGSNKGIEDDRIKAPETPTICIQEEDEYIRPKKTEQLDGDAELSAPKYKNLSPSIPLTPPFNNNIKEALIKFTQVSGSMKSPRDERLVDSTFCKDKISTESNLNSM